MYIDVMSPQPSGKNGPWGESCVGVFREGQVLTLEEVLESIRSTCLKVFTFEDREIFSDNEYGLQLCAALREAGVNILWTARLNQEPSCELLQEMRLAGCQRLDFFLPSVGIGEVVSRVRKFGFAVRLCSIGGVWTSRDEWTYSVAERERVATLLPDVHAVHFELAVAYYKARRYREVMLPLGKAMTLGFPMNTLCLNLLACLSAVKHYPDMAAGLLEQAAYDCPPPVVSRNRREIRAWLESGGDVRGVPLILEPEASLHV
ncbi:tetratricopeptide repeat protein [Pseudodesulfovibrio piezophilus]|uniref:Uncharacterized protein n=1 Tax=Pseudodesulfovibrio piezophilus (strain DSM 21447 / JCM 15486 / C1TLV30) TaxID=1322246 RepID=M1WLM9_PSEP2|nr:hypothetical protein [Pseudodesulfovibrio piezophilus]CCH48140.1 conserved protein of unknown function [Pseudodesulfovibrio piezophilus C1TLV30]